MVDRPGDIVKVKKRMFGKRTDAGRIGVIRDLKHYPFSKRRWAQVDFGDYDSQEPQKRVYNVKELESVQEVRAMPSHIRRAEKRG